MAAHEGSDHANADFRARYSAPGRLPGAVAEDLQSASLCRRFVPSLTVGG